MYTAPLHAIKVREVLLTRLISNGMDNSFAEYEKFSATIGVTFKDIALLREAFTHRSYLNEHRGTHMKDNERLEFLGDAVLELVMTEYLFAKYPE